MSATGRSNAAGTGHIRHPDDFYKTEPWVTRAILPHVVILHGAIVLDPCCGDGAILDVVREVRPDVVTVGIEIDAGRAAAAAARGHRVVEADALGLAAGMWCQPDIVLTNPPFALAMQFVQRAIAERKAGGSAVFLQRLPWLASKGRATWLRANTPSVNVLPERPSFCAVITCKQKKHPTTPCDFHVTLPVDAPRPSKCPTCSGPVQITTTDATDYAWYSWREGDPPIVRILDGKKGGAS